MVDTDPDAPHVLTVPVPESDSLGAGLYTVVWGTFSAEDDHTSSGSFTFSAGTGVAPEQELGPTEEAVTVAIAGKWLELMGVLLLAGLGIFGATTRSTVVKHSEGRVNPYVALALVGLVGACVSFRAREIAITGSSILGPVDGGTVSDLIDSTYGVAWIVRLAALLGVVGLAVWASREWRRSALFGIAILGLIAVATIAVSGHAGAIDPSWVAAEVDFLHMAGAAVWLGGLLGLLLVVDPPVGSEAYRLLLRTQGNRFLAAVALILAAGAVSAWWHVVGRREVTGSGYGQTLLIKIAVVAVVLGIAYYDRRVLQSERPRLEWTPIATGLELMLAMVVLLFSADLSQTPPANQPLPIQVAARAIELNASETSGESTAHLSGILTGDPADWITVAVDPTTELQRVIVRTSLTDAATGTVVGDRFDAEPIAGAAGQFRFPAGRLGVAGDWLLEATVRRAGMSDEIFSIPVNTSGLAGRETTFVSDSWGGFRPTSHTALALGLAVVMLLVGLGGIRRITGFEPLASGFLLAASSLMAGGFLVSAARGVVSITPNHELPNRMFRDPDTLTYAGELYRVNCAACHGADGNGVGDGNLAHVHGNGADLTRGRTVEQSDGDLRYWIANGVPGSEMPAFSPALTGNEQWQLVLYIRQLQEAAQAAAEAEQ